MWCTDEWDGGKASGVMSEEEEEERGARGAAALYEAQAAVT